MKKQISTVSSVLKWGCKQLEKSNVDTPRLDAEVLLAYCINTDRTNLYAINDNELDEISWQRYTQCIQRRVRREPVAYITGKKEFYSLAFKVTSDVLIPRPETETLVEESLKACMSMREKMSALNILELGTGSGIIAVILAKRLETSYIIATDISLKIVEVARNNAKLHNVKRKINFLVSRSLEALKEKGKNFDLIVSNPPYVSASDWEKVQPEIKEYEPTDALLAGEDGLDFYRKITFGADGMLAREGWLMLEVGMGQKDAVSRMIKKTGKFKKLEVVNDLSGIPRVVKAQKG
ncbi:MAG: peptide chain release factor N(5)-glutamine methyltransferase [Deltaproteobacteria bacterium]|nr:peptide chain release factor N(5)-glutamine methyltransferase [Deltaproteobacteria bacterium]